MSLVSAVAGQRITAANTNANIPGPWQALTLQNSWTNAAGNAAAQCRMLNSVTVQVVATLSGGLTGTQIVALLPNSSFYPANSINGSYGIQGGSGGGGALNIRSDGTIHCYGIPATSIIGLCIDFPIDAA
jgi:hypothetical protein